MTPPTPVPYIEHPDLEYQLQKQLERHPKTLLLGVGGAGKTAFLTHYAEDHARLYADGVFLLDATSESTAHRGLAGALPRLLAVGSAGASPSPRRMTDLPDEVMDVLQVRLGYVRSSGPLDAEWIRALATYALDRLECGGAEYLLVFDNAMSAGVVDRMLSALRADAADPELLTQRMAECEPFLQHGVPHTAWAKTFVDDYMARLTRVAARQDARGFRGSVLVVSNRDDGDGKLSVWPMPEFLGADGAGILAAHAGDESIASMPETLALVDDLGGLPLALAQAGATLRARRYGSVADYRRDLVRALAEGDDATAPTSVTRMRSAPSHDSVLRTTELALRATHAALGDGPDLRDAETILDQCAVLAPTCLAEGLISAMTDAPARRAVEALTACLLLQPSPRTAGALRMHRAHQSALVARMGERRDEVVRAASRSVSRALADPDRCAGMTPSEYDSFVSVRDHADRCLRLLPSVVGADACDAEDGLPTEAAVQDLLREDASTGSATDAYTLADLLRESRIERWILAGRWQAVLTGVNRPGLTLDDMYSLETEADHRRLRHICVSLWRAGTPTETMTAAACMFFAAHYWWTEYIPEDHICRPVLIALESGARKAEARAGASSAVELTSCLRGFYDNYPPSHYYHERTTGSADEWRVVEAAVRRIRGMLGIGRGDRHRCPDGDGLPDARTYARAITAVYLAMAIRYANDRHDPDDPETWGLFDEAEAALAESGDAMHHSWCAFERADAYVDSARHLLAQSAGLFGRSAHAKARRYLDMGLAMCAECRLRASRGERVDAEMVAQAYQMEGDAFWMLGRRDEALTRYCAAAVLGLAYLIQDQDDYSRHFYEEMRGQTTGRIREVLDETDGLAPALAMSRYVFAFWNTTADDPFGEFETVFLPLTDPAPPNDATANRRRRAILSAKLDRDLLPPTPRMADLRSDKAESAYLTHLRGVLAAMPDHVRGLDAPGYVLPPDFADPGGYLDTAADRAAP